MDPALMDGLLQVVPEYTGSALEFFSLGRLSATSDTGTANKVLAASVAGDGLVAASPAPAQDANALVVTAATAARYGLRSIADLAKVAPGLVLGGRPECPGRAYCLPGLKRVYGLRFKAFTPLDAGGPQTLQALTAGYIGVALLSPPIRASRRGSAHLRWYVLPSGARNTIGSATCPASPSSLPCPCRLKGPAPRLDLSSPSATPTRRSVARPTRSTQPPAQSGTLP